MPLVGVNHYQSTMKMSKRMVYIYSTDEQMNPFAIGYAIKPSLHVNKVFREQVKKCLLYTFNEKNGNYNRCYEKS